MTQNGLDVGKLVTWTKTFNCPNVVGMNAVQLLRDALRKRGDVDVDVMAVLNDTTGTWQAGLGWPGVAWYGRAAKPAPRLRFRAGKRARAWAGRQGVGRRSSRAAFLAVQRGPSTCSLPSLPSCLPSLPLLSSLPSSRRRLASYSTLEIGPSPFVTTACCASCIGGGERGGRSRRSRAIIPGRRTPTSRTDLAVLAVCETRRSTSACSRAPR